MKLALSFLALVTALTGKQLTNAAEEPVLTERVLTIALTSAKLSALAYENATEYATFGANGTVTGFTHPDYEDINFFTEEPDQAIVAKVDGRCYIAFRGTTTTYEDWVENINIKTDDAYKNNDNTTGEFCVVRKGYSDFLRTSVVGQANQDLMSCITTCTDPDDCLIITGHSQGGASAAIASILTYDLKPTVITFGMPPAAKKDCDLIPSERLYRFVNHRAEEGEIGDLGFDPIPFVPTIFSKAVHYGYYLMVGPDGTAAKYLGLDQDYTFEVGFSDHQNEIESHSMAGQNYSYTTRIMNLLNTGNTTGFPVSIDGFVNGTVCELQYSELCETGSCQKNVCAEPISDLCIKGSCEKDEDCAGSRVCIWDACASSNGEVAGGCPCQSNANCKSGDCDTKFTSLDWVCEYGVGETPPSSSLTLEFAFFAKSLIAGVVLGAFL